MSLSIVPSDPREDWVWLARVRRPQGRKGEVFAEILTDFPEKFAERRKVWLLKDEGAPSSAPRAMELVNHWQHKGGIVLHFAGIDSISAAETLTGLTVAIPQSQRAALGEDEIYISDLIGCNVIDVAGSEPREIGKIRNVDRTAGPVPLLIVDAMGGEVLIPFAKSYLRSVNVPDQRVEMALPEGLVDLNAAS
jgi:16S rRNA processing protein RimM